MEAVRKESLISQVEDIPAEYPDVTGILSETASAIDTDAIWARIESYIAYRFTPRTVVWTVEGGGEWTPALTPVISFTAEVWEMGSWVTTTLQEGPFGYCLISDGPYRITAQVGGGDAPAAVTEAFRRLAEYSASIGEDSWFRGRAGTTSFTGKIDEMEVSGTRSATWTAKAIQNSGAADLLRPYRRAP